MTRLLSLLLAVPLLACAASHPSAREVAPPDPGWVAYILPQPAEVEHEALTWLPTFGQGVLAANERQKPLLFWAMNGHPLGCT